MRIKQNTNKKKIIITSVIVALLIAAGASAYFLSQGANQEDRPENTPDYNAPTDAQKQAGDKAKEDFIKKQDEAAKNDAGEEAGNPGSEQPVSLTVSSAAQNGSTYQIRTIIETLDGSGVCSLELTKSGADVVTQEVGTQILGSYSVCKGFDVPVDGMQKGSWQAKISYKGSKGQSGSVQRTIEVQ